MYDVAIPAAACLLFLVAILPPSAVISEDRQGANEPPESPVIRPSASGEIETQDGLYLRFRNATGELLSLMTSATHVPLRVTTEEYPTFSVTDYGDSSRSGRIRVRGEGAGEHALAITGESEDSKLSLACSAHALSNYVRFSLRVLDTSGEDRAVTVRFQIPVKAEGWTWWDDVATPRAIERGKSYVRYDDRQKGIFPLFWYPLGAISEAGGQGLAFAVPMDPPTLGRVGYDGDFFIEFDVGLTQATEKFPGRADFTFYLCHYDGKWGLRSALKKYYDLFPQYFVKRVSKEGLWLDRTPTHLIEHPEDFGMTFHQVSSVMTNSIPLDNAMGLYTFLYDEPGRVGITLPFEEEGQLGVPRDGPGSSVEGPGRRGPRRPSREYVLRKVKEFAEDAASAQHTSALVTLAVASQRPDGTFYITLDPRPGFGWRCLFAAGFDPEMIVPGRNETRLESWRRDQLARMMSLYDGRYDGQYIDSSEWMADTLNCRKDHFAYTDYPPGFDEKTATPAINTGVTRFEYLKAVREELLKAGKLMMANGTPFRFGFFATLMDVAGAETWHSRAKPPGFGEEAAPDERTWLHAHDWRNEQAMYYRRAMLYQKPFCSLLKLMTPEDVQAFGMKRLTTYLDWCTFFAVYPSIAHGLALDPDPLREIYRKYVPVIRALGTAGWEPLTYATTDNPALRVERYGHWSQGTLYFAVRNFSDDAAAGNLTIDAGALHIGEGASLRSAFAGQEAGEGRENGKIILPLALDGTKTEVIHVGLGWEKAGTPPAGG